MATQKSRKAKGTRRLEELTSFEKSLVWSYPSWGDDKPIGELTPQERRLAKIVELQLFISPRGRSVATGSMLIAGRIQSFKHELAHDEKTIFLKAFVYAFNISDD